MASKPVVDAVEARAAAGWDKCPIFGINTNADPPTDGSPFLVFQYLLPESRQLTVGAPGANVWREEGVIRIAIHARRGEGAAKALEWADELAALFRGKDFGGVQTFAPSPASDGFVEGNYYVTAIAVPYQFDFVG